MGEHAYIVSTIGMSQTGEKMVLDGFVDHPGVINTESSFRLQRVKIVADRTLTADPLLQVLQTIRVQVASIFDVDEDRYLYGSPSGEPQATLRSSSFPPNETSRLEQFKRLWLEQHPSWRRDHPPTDQDPSPSE